MGDRKDGREAGSARPGNSNPDRRQSRHPANDLLRELTHASFYCPVGHGLRTPQWRRLKDPVAFWVPYELTYLQDSGLALLTFT